MRAVVFDFDGVIANSEPVHFRGFRDVLAEQGIHLTEADYYGRYLGYDDRGTFLAIGVDCGVRWGDDRVAELVQRKASRLEELERGAPLLFPGAAAAIRRLAGACSLAIASGAIRPEIVKVLNREDLTPYFAAIVTAEDTTASKPAPDPYIKAVAQLSTATGLSLAAWECAAIEDSRWGLESARIAGLRTIAVTHTFPAEALSRAEVVIPHLDLLTWELLSTLSAKPPAPAVPESSAKRSI